MHCGNVQQGSSGDLDAIDAAVVPPLNRRYQSVIRGTAENAKSRDCREDYRGI